MENRSLIDFAEEKVEQFKIDLSKAKQDEKELLNDTIITLNGRKNEYWGEIMEKIQRDVEPDKLKDAYTLMSKYHTQFQNAGGIYE